MEIHFAGLGPPELRRPDGWFYRLHGIGGIETHVGFDYDARLIVTIYDVSDRTLDSIKVIRDNFPNYSIQLQHDY